jgi:pimeloyl-ACP methyl ester carboxylesterase
LGCSVLLLVATTATAAQRLILRSGFEITGETKLDGNRVVVRSGPRTYYVGAKQLLKPELASDVEPPVRISVPQPTSKPTRGIESLVNIIRISPFDEFGRRTILLRSNKSETAVHQGIVELFPGYVVLQGLNRAWRTAEWTARIPSAELLPILRKAVDASSAIDRLKVVDFLIQAGRFQEAKDELALIRTEFPEETTRSAELQEKLDRRIAQVSLDAIQQAIEAGQWRRARSIVQALGRHPVPPNLQPPAAQYGRELDALDQRMGQARSRLLLLRSTAGKPDQQAAAEALEEIERALSPTTVARLAPMLALADQPTIRPDELLALAVSGWVLGPDLAGRDLGAAQTRWRQFTALRDALKAEDEAFPSELDRLTALELTADAAWQMLSRVPAPRVPGNELRHVVAVEVGGETPVNVYVQLPPEYDPYREYPAILALHGLTISASRLLELWSAPASRFGVIIVAPEHRPDPTKAYQFSGEEHQILAAVLRAVRRRFAIDADRVFLSGHDLGAVAAWDYGMAHPDEFAGIIPLGGVPQFYCIRYWPNLAYLPVYAVEGTAHGDNVLVLRGQFERYFQNDMDAIYVEYPGRGRDSFAGELPSILDWTTRYRRKLWPQELDVVTARLGDRRFYWLEAESFLPRAVIPPELFQKDRFRPARMQGKVTDKSTILVTTSGLESLSIRLSQNLVPLSDPDLNIRVNRNLVHRGPVEPDLVTLINELRRTGDRKNLVVKKIIVPNL